MLPGSASSITPSDLLGLSRFLTNTLDNTAAFSDTNILALVNLKYRALQTRLLAALNFDWKESTVDGSGSGSVTLTADGNTYAFPTDMLQIDRVEINYSGITDAFVPATIIPLQGYGKTSVANISTTSRSGIGSKSSPVVYIRNKVLVLDPMPDTTVSGGIRVWGQTLIADLTVGGTAPVFESAYHEILAYETAQTWCAAKDREGKANRLIQEATAKFKEMVEFYSNRVDTEQPVVSVPQRSMR